jgi:hypothetical protein
MEERRLAQTEERNRWAIEQIILAWLTQAFIAERLEVQSTHVEELRTEHEQSVRKQHKRKRDSVL